MKKLIDRLIKGISLLLVIYALACYITDDFLISAGILFLAILAIQLIKKIIPKRTKFISRASFAEYLLMEGNAVSTPMLVHLFPPKKSLGSEAFSSMTEYISTADFWIINSISYSSFGCEKAAQLYRQYRDKSNIAREITGFTKTDSQSGIRKMVIFYNAIDRAAIGILNKLPFPVTIVKLSHLYTLLKRKGCLPEKKIPTVSYGRDKRPKQRKFEFSKWKIRAKNYLGEMDPKWFAFAAASSLFMSLWIPVKTYYFVMAGINGLIAIVLWLAKMRAKLSVKIDE
ncbi:MAG: hypothetical protein IJX70_04235 [Clostridia bacterium]|nr:hypothetical protein [Clostridia bacterium]